MMRSRSCRPGCSGGRERRTISARPEMMFEIERVLALRGHTLPGFLELLGHAVERLGHLAELVVTLDGQRRAPPALAESADGVGEARQRVEDLALEHEGDEEGEGRGE